MRYMVVIQGADRRSLVVSTRPGHERFPIK